MTNKIVAVQGNHPTKLNPKTDTTIFLAKEAQERNYKIFYFLELRSRDTKLLGYESGLAELRMPNNYLPEERSEESVLHNPFIPNVYC